ncbi:ABC transporter permease [Paenibacillus sepulcri]|uniref:Sugar ABC transporter permease n=1 Tax=Paenibacillus sepulcri TaxID=359917 RepID=A0ABS7C4A8_9BACL|nr:sugar ABC transporter permease [Paenibacillus sepulcri]
MILPGLIYFLIFKYLPMWGMVIAFQDYIAFLGVTGSKWVGFKHFVNFFNDPDFMLLFRNTILLALYNLFFFFPLPILIALMLNELRNQILKRWVQSLIYIPHFMSWVVISGIVYILLTPEAGIVNELIASMGWNKINFLASSDWFRSLIILEVIWRETGWGTIIFLAALAGVDPQLYEASRIDGAGRMRQLWHITLPCIRSTIVILLILRLGNFMDSGFEQIFLMMNAMNREVAEVFDTYVYTYGIVQGQFSYSTAVGLFKSLIALILVIGANYAAKKFGEEGIY